MSEARPAPGDQRPRLLEEAPGERYAQARRSRSAAPALPVSARRGLAWGFVATLAVALGIAVLVGILDLGVGPIAVSALGGWAIGYAVKAGARVGEGRPRGSTAGVAVSLALGAWLAGEFGAYLLTLLLRPDSSLSFVDRLAQQSFLDWLSPQFGPTEVLEIVLIAGLAWFASRR